MQQCHQAFLNSPEVRKSFPLDEEKAETILFRKMENVEKEVNDVRQNVGEVLVRIDHLRSDHSVVKVMMGNLESIMFGHNVNAGLMTRIELLERSEDRRINSEKNKTTMFTGLWIAIILLVLERVFEFLASAQP